MPPRNPADAVLSKLSKISQRRANQHVVDMDATTVNVICAMLENRRGLAMTNAKQWFPQLARRPLIAAYFHHLLQSKGR